MTTDKDLDQLFRMEAFSTLLERAKTLREQRDQHCAAARKFSRFYALLNQMFPTVDDNKKSDDEVIKSFGDAIDRVSASEARLREALDALTYRQLSDGPCFCLLWPDEDPAEVIAGKGHGAHCIKARAALTTEGGDHV